MCTTGQVSVRVMPSRFCTLETTSLPSSSTLRASARTITSYGPVTSSARVTPLTWAMAEATSAALPTSVWIRMYAWTTIVLSLEYPVLLGTDGGQPTVRYDRVGRSRWPRAGADLVGWAHAVPARRHPRRRRRVRTDRRARRPVPAGRAGPGRARWRRRGAAGADRARRGVHRPDGRGP